MSLGAIGAHTRIAPVDGPDQVWLNDEKLTDADPFVSRLRAYLDLFDPAQHYTIHTASDVPVAAGLASSASGFAALVLALDDLYGWSLDPTSLSILARLGSGSACRSIYQGFVEWQAGEQADGMDSYAVRLDADWPALRIGWIECSSAPKPIGSRAGMKRTVETSALYAAWPDQVARDLAAIKQAIAQHDFEALGSAAESNALAMHATMWAARPPVSYWLPETVVTLRAVWQAREQGLPVYATMDAGPNVKLLYLADDRERIRAAFPQLHEVNPA